MTGKYIIQDNKTEKWLGLDFPEGSGTSLIFVSKFQDAVSFGTRQESREFLLNYQIERNGCSLFRVKEYAESISWNKPNKED